TFEFTDIAGIVKGASKGEGLGNQFLSHIRQVDAVCQVVRCFEDDQITHVSGKVDPLDDIETINLELILADLETINKRYERVKKKGRQKKSGARGEFENLQMLMERMEDGKLPARALDVIYEQKKIIKQLYLLTAKTMLYGANFGEDDIVEPKSASLVQQVNA